MTKDDRLYAKFTLDFPDHPKILCLSVEAKWALVDMTIYSRRHLTDGWLSKPVAIAKWGLDVCLELASNDVEKPSLVEHETGFQIHDFAEHQTTKAEIKALSEVRKAAGQKGGQASAQAKSKQVLKQNPSKIKPETETETEIKTKEPPYPPNDEPPPTAHQPTRKTGAELARTRYANLPARSLDAYRIAEAFSASLPVPVEPQLLSGIGTQIDKCLQRGIPPPAIAAGLKAWTDSDSWSPTQIPTFVHKANNGSRVNGHGKPTEKALGYDTALTELLQEVTTL